MKKTLAILLALVLCFSAFALIACNKCDHNYVDGVCTKCGDKDPNYKPNGGGDDVDVPTVEGKVTLYFTLADESVAIPSYASFYFTGGQTAFATGLDAIEFTRLNDSKVYYVQIAYDKTKTQADEYAIVLGYNASSELPTDKLGLKWVDDYKSDECAAIAFPGNAKFTVADGANKASLGKHTFSTEVAKPERVNTSFAITFEPALPETAEVYLIGSMNEWNTTDLTKSKMTANAERDIYTISISDVLCSTHYYKVLVFLNGTENVVKPLDTEGKEMDIWNWQRPGTPATQADEEESETPAEKKYLAYIEISAGDDNLPVDVAKRHNNSTVNLAGTNRKAEYDKDGVTVINPKKGLDILTASNLTEVEGKKTVVNETTGKEEQVPNGIMSTKYIVVANKTLTVTFATALPEDVGGVYVIGSFRKTGSDWGISASDASMTIAEDRLSASVTYEMLPGAYEYNIIFVHKNIDLQNKIQNIWDNGVKLKAEGNYTLNITGFADGTVELQKNVTVPDVPAPVPVTATLKVKFDKALPEGKHVLITGDLNGWKGEEMTVDADDATVYTLTKEIYAKDYRFKLCLCDTTELNYGTAYGTGGVLGAGDASFTVTKDSTEIDLFGETVLETPAAEVEVTLTVTFSGMDLTGKYIGIKGAMTGWALKEMQTEDNLTYTLTVKATPGENKFIIIIGADEADANALGQTGSTAIKIASDGAAGGADAVVTIEAAGTVNLFDATVDLSTVA